MFLFEFDFQCLFVRGPWISVWGILRNVGVILETLRDLLDPFQEPPWKYLSDPVNSSLQGDWQQHPCRCPLAYLR